MENRGGENSESKSKEVLNGTEDTIGMTDQEMKDQIIFFVKEVYGNYGSKCKVYKDDEGDGLWIAFLPEKKVTLFADVSLKKIYDLAFDEYEGYILYGFNVNSNQFDPMEVN